MFSGDALLNCFVFLNMIKIQLFEYFVFMLNKDVFCVLATGQLCSSEASTQKYK